MILSKIADATKIRINSQKEEIPLDIIKKSALNMNIDKKFPFEKALHKNDIAFICEVKKASPSKGIIAEHFPYIDIAKDYEKAGADAISVLTEPDFFLGKGEYLKEISKQVKIPLLRKDFIIDQYQIYEAKVLGANAVLLRCSLLDTEKLKEYIKICDNIGISALVEAHTKEEILSAIKAGARIIGINNRNLKTFKVDIQNAVNLRQYVPKDIIFIAESGIKTAEDIDILRKADVNAVLIGETLMKSHNKKEMLDSLKGCV